MPAHARMCYFEYDLHVLAVNKCSAAGSAEISGSEQQQALALDDGRIHWKNGVSDESCEEWWFFVW